MPYLFSPAGEPDVWKPHTPEVLYSHIGFDEIPAARLPGCRTANQPPFDASKFHGTLSARLGPVALNRMPRSRALFGTTSASVASSTPLSFRSSPRMFETAGVATQVPPGHCAFVVQLTIGALLHLGTVVPFTNMLEKGTSSSGRKNSLTGSRTSGRSMIWLRFRSRTLRLPGPPAGKSVE